MSATAFSSMGEAASGDQQAQKSSTLDHLSEVNADYAALSRFANVLAHIQNSHLASPDSAKLMDGAIRGLVSSLDPHSAYLTEAELQEMSRRAGEENRADIGLSLAGVDVMHLSIQENHPRPLLPGRSRALVVVAPEDNSPAANAGLIPGDIVTHIEGISTDGMDVDRAAFLLAGKPDTKVTLGILRKGFKAPRAIALVRKVPKKGDVEFESLAGGTVALVKIKRFAVGTSQAVKQAIASLKKKASQSGTTLTGAILDLRNNPGGRLDEAVRTAELFLPGGKVVYRLSGRGGEVLEAPTTHGSGNKFTLPLAILTNEGTASAAEVLAGALQDEKRATLVGSQTFGKGSVQLAFSLEGGGALKLTVGLCTTPLGRDIHGVGLKPEVQISTEGNHDVGNTPRSLDFLPKIEDNSEVLSLPESASSDVAVDVALKAALQIVQTSGA